MQLYFSIRRAYSSYRWLHLFVVLPDFGRHYAKMQALNSGSWICLLRLSKLFFPPLLVLLQNFALWVSAGPGRQSEESTLKGCSECLSSPAGCRYYWRPHEKDYSNIFTLASWIKGYKQVLNKYPNLCLLSQTQTLKLLMQPCYRIHCWTNLNVWH